jgi:hypothetical protein
MDDLRVLKYSNTDSPAAKIIQVPIQKVEVSNLLLRTKELHRKVSWALKYPQNMNKRAL